MQLPLTALTSLLAGSAPADSAQDGDLMRVPRIVVHFG